MDFRTFMMKDIVSSADTVRYSFVKPARSSSRHGQGIVSERCAICLAKTPSSNKFAWSCAQATDNGQRTRQQDECKHRRCGCFYTLGVFALGILVIRQPFGSAPSEGNRALPVFFALPVPPALPVLHPHRSPRSPAPINWKPLAHVSRLVYGPPLDVACTLLPCQRVQTARRSGVFMTPGTEVLAACTLES